MRKKIVPTIYVAIEEEEAVDDDMVPGPASPHTDRRNAMSMIPKKPRYVEKHRLMMTHVKKQEVIQKFNDHVGIAIINHPFLMVTTHLW